jgi:hypothetical protein
MSSLEQIDSLLDEIRVALSPRAPTDFGLTTWFGLEPEEELIGIEQEIAFPFPAPPPEMHQPASASFRQEAG